jgi:hypothetical protein
MPGRSPLQLASALGDSSPGAALLSRLAASRRVARILAKAPELSDCGIDFERPGFCELRDQVLRLTVHSPAEFAKLRQNGPAMQQTLSTHGLQGIQIKLTVQPCHTDYRIRVSNKNLVGTAIDSVDGKARALLDPTVLMAFAEKLVLTIHNPLIHASAKRMYRAARKRLAGMREDEDG